MNCDESVSVDQNAEASVCNETGHVLPVTFFLCVRINKCIIYNTVHVFGMQLVALLPRGNYSVDGYWYMWDVRCCLDFEKSPQHCS